MSKVLIYGTPNCGYCKQAINVCEGSDLKYNYIDLATQPEQQAVLEEKLSKPVMTVPQIFVDDTYIGGYDEFLAYIRNQ